MGIIYILPTEFWDASGFSLSCPFWSRLHLLRLKYSPSPWSVEKQPTNHKQWIRSEPNSCDRKNPNKILQFLPFIAILAVSILGRSVGSNETSWWFLCIGPHTAKSCHSSSGRKKAAKWSQFLDKSIELDTSETKIYLIYLCQTKTGQIGKCKTSCHSWVKLSLVTLWEKRSTSLRSIAQTSR